jgi:ribosomal protein S6
MDDTNIHDDRPTVYEIGYLISDKVPEDKVSAEVDAIRKIVSDASASVIAEEMPHRQTLEYTIRAKTLGGSYDKHDQVYFGWIKFEVGSSKIIAMKKAIESLPSVLRMLLITTVRENTYLGKRAPAIAATFGAKREVTQSEPEEKREIAPASIEEMDKSIDAMVKEV